MVFLGTEPPHQPNCQASACHCEHLQPAAYLVELPNGREQRVSRQCADMHMAAGYPIRPIKRVTETG